MNLAAIFALLLQSGVCGQSQFRGPDGTVLTVIVCPQVAHPETETPEAPPVPPSHRS